MIHARKGKRCVGRYWTCPGFVGRNYILCHASNTQGLKMDGQWESQSANGSAPVTQKLSLIEKAASPEIHNHRTQPEPLSFSISFSFTIRSSIRELDWLLVIIRSCLPYTPYTSTYMISQPFPLLHMTDRRTVPHRCPNTSDFNLALHQLPLA